MNWKCAVGAAVLTILVFIGVAGLLVLMALMDIYDAVAIGVLCICGAGLFFAIFTEFYQHCRDHWAQKGGN